MSSLRIVPLNAVPELRDTLADWLWRAFGTENSRDFFASILDSSLSGADLPLTFVALDGDRALCRWFVDGDVDGDEQEAWIDLKALTVL